MRTQEPIMCGRYTLTSFDNLQVELGLAAPPELAAPRYNIAPGQMVPVVQNRPERTLTAVRWGLVPYWADDPRIGNRMINARSESVTEKPAFRNALSRRRCLVVADGFYEWQRPALPSGSAAGHGRSTARGETKIPHYIHRRSGAPFGMAGLWERWKAPDGNWLETCTILTCDANALMAPLHARMPLILDRASYDLWLDPAPLPPEALAPLLATPPVGDFEAYPVSTLVNAPQYDDPACIAPAEASPGPRAGQPERGQRPARARSARKPASRETQPSLFDFPPGSPPGPKP
jgi:putative SOS response-associated peptidase YedK